MNSYRNERRSLLGLSGLLLLSAFGGACSSAPDVGEDPVASENSATRSEEVVSLSRPIDRVIPIRFIRHTQQQANSITQQQIDEQVNGTNTIFADAGISFYSLGVQTVPSSPLAKPLAQVTAQQAPAALSFLRPGCTVPPADEPRDNALLRAATYCGRDEELVVFIVDDAAQAWGAFPWEARGLVIQNSWFEDADKAGNRVLAHEIGHYLGLPHAFRGCGGGYDLSTEEIPPSCPGNASNVTDLRTGLPAKLSTFWDLVYQPGGNPDGSNRFFSSEQEASSVPDSYLRPIQGNAGWPDSPLMWVCTAPGGGGECASGVPEGALRVALPRTLEAWDACNTSEWASASCPCKPTPSLVGMTGQWLHTDVSQRCDVRYTPDPALKGMGFVPSAALGTTYSINIMSYNYAPGVTSASAWRLSESQVAHVKRSLKYEAASSMFPGGTGARPLLGVGVGQWSGWESLAGAPSARPAIVSRTGGRLDVVITSTGTRGSGGVLNKVRSTDAGGWWPSQSSWATVSPTAAVGAPSLVWQGDALGLFTRTSSNTIRFFRWTGAWSSSDLPNAMGADPVAVGGGAGELDVFTRSTASDVQAATWNAATSALGGWLSLGGSTLGSPTAARRGTGHVDVIALGTDSRAYNKVRNPGGGWWPSTTGWTGLGAQTFEETPRIATSGAYPIVLVGRATPSLAARQAKLKIFNSNGWWPGQTSWFDLGGNLAGPPSVVAHGSGRIDVVARSSQDTLLYKTWDPTTGAWFPSDTGWAVLAVAIGGDPAATSPDPEALDIVVRSQNGELWHISRR